MKEKIRVEFESLIKNKSCDELNNGKQLFYFCLELYCQVVGDERLPIEQQIELINSFAKENVQKNNNDRENLNRKFEELNNNFNKKKK